jgi:CBS domain-containing protein
MTRPRPLKRERNDFGRQEGGDPMTPISRYMTGRPQTIAPSDTLAAAEERMRRGRFRRLPVVDGETLVGILSDRDLARHVGHLAETRVTAAMTENPLTISSSAPFEDAVRRMLASKIDSLPVVEDGKLVGIVTTTDVGNAFLEASSWLEVEDE